MSAVLGLDNSSGRHRLTTRIYEVRIVELLSDAEEGIDTILVVGLESNR
jgi:hypothetical protein